MRAWQKLRDLPVETPPPLGVRERVLEALRNSLVTLPDVRVSGDVPYPNTLPPAASAVGGKMALIALGSSLLGASLAVELPRFVWQQQPTATPVSAGVLVPTAQQQAFTQAQVAAPQPAMSAGELGVVTAPPAATPRLSQAPRRTKILADSLGAERLLLEEARQQMSLGHHELAYRASESHRSRFPAGVLAEEREALAIVALAKMGRRDLAEPRRQNFSKTYPASFMASTIAQALGEAP